MGKARMFKLICLLEEKISKMDKEKTA